MEGADGCDLPDPAAAQELHRLLHDGARTAHQSYLSHPPVAARCFHDLAPFSNHQGKRLLDVDILSGVAGLNTLQRMPVVRRADHHRIDVLQFKQAAIILELPRTASDFPGREIQVGLVEITNRHHFRIPMLEKSVEYLIPAISQSDKPQADAIVCAVTRLPPSAVARLAAMACLPNCLRDSSLIRSAFLVGFDSRAPQPSR